MCQIRWENDCVLTSVSLCQEVFSVVCLNLHLSCARICHAMYVDILEGHKLLHIYLSHNPEMEICDPNHAGENCYKFWEVIRKGLFRKQNNYVKMRGAINQISGC